MALGFHPHQARHGDSAMTTRANSPPRKEQHRPSRQCPQPPRCPPPPLGAARRIQAHGSHGCGVWKLFGKCFLDAEMRAGRLCPAECLCVSRRSRSPPPAGPAPAFLSGLGGRWAPLPGPRLGRGPHAAPQMPHCPPQCPRPRTAGLWGEVPCSWVGWGQQKAERSRACPTVVPVPWYSRTPPP